MENTVLKVEEAAEILRVSKSKVYQLIRENRLPHIKLDGRVVIPRARFLSWIENSVVGGVTA
jgi:excisionase family DNA binding protein